MIRSWARRVCRRLSRTNGILMTSDHPEHSAKIDVSAVIAIRANLSQSRGCFSQCQLCFLEGLCVRLRYSFSRSLREKHGCKEIKKGAKTPTWIHMDNTRSLTGIYCSGLRAKSPAGSDAFLDLTGLRTWRLAEPVVDTSGDISSLCDITEDLIPEPYVCISLHATFKWRQN